MKLKIFINDNDYNKYKDRLYQIENIVKEDFESVFSEATDTDVETVRGLPTGLSDFLMAVMVISTEMSRNAGKQIVEYKKKLIKSLQDFGIIIDLTSLDIRTIPSDTDTKSADSSPVTDNSENKKGKSSEGEFDYEERSKQYIPVEPSYSFDRVILPEDVLEKINEALGILECENKVFKEWGLYEIQPHPSSSLSFFGAPGTGKTMAAEAIAQKLGKKILKVSYADVESKYHGEGPKMVKAIFLAAARADAVLFFDEADSLLSKRLTNVTQGSEQAINSMRSQLLICLEEFRGIVIFATNLVVNYDQAFLTRLISIEFKKPDAETREKIWRVHVKASDDGRHHQLNIPLADDVDLKELADKYEFVGREIRNAVVSACVSTALDHRDLVTQADFVKACDKIVDEQESLANAKDHTQATNDILKKALQEKLKKKKETDGGETDEKDNDSKVTTVSEEKEDK